MSDNIEKTNLKIAQIYHEMGFDRWVEKFKTVPRESEKAMLATIGTFAKERGQRLKLADLGCGVGTLLAHVRRIWPDAELVGVDLASAFVEASQRDPILKGVRFVAADIVNPSLIKAIGDDNDVVAMHAVTQLMTMPTLERCIDVSARVMKPGGLFIDYDCFQKYHQDMRIQLGEHNIYYHNQDAVRALMIKAGFKDIHFEEFKIQVDLDPGESLEATRTVKLANGERLMIRGAILQHWHLLTARKT